MPMTPEGAWRNAAPSTLASTGPAPHEQLVFTHPEAVAAWGLSSHEAGELQGDDAVGPGGHGADSDPRRRLTTPAARVTTLPQREATPEPMWG